MSKKKSVSEQIKAVSKESPAVVAPEQKILDEIELLKLSAVVAKRNDMRTRLNNIGLARELDKTQFQAQMAKYAEAEKSLQADLAQIGAQETAIVGAFSKRLGIEDIKEWQVNLDTGALTKVEKPEEKTEPAAAPATPPAPQAAPVPPSQA